MAGELRLKQVMWDEVAPAVRKMLPEVLKRLTDLEKRVARLEERSPVAKALMPKSKGKK